MWAVQLRLWARNTGRDAAALTEDFNERAAIREYLGEMSREEAEQAAFFDVRRREAERDR